MQQMILKQSNNLHLTQVPINRQVDKKVVIRTHNGLFFRHKKRIKPYYLRQLLFATTYYLMDLEGIMLSEIRQSEKKKIPNDFISVWNLKNKINEQIETNS